MGQHITAEDIREFAYSRYILPARRAGLREVRIRAGDVHHALKLANRHPAVCGALGADKFQTQYRLRRSGRQGATSGANVWFTFEILP